MIRAMEAGSILKSAYLAVGLAQHAGQQIVILDLSDPALPSEKGRIDTPFESGELAIEDLSFFGSHIFVTLVGPGGGLWTIDASNPLSPQHVAFMQVEGSLLRGLYVADDLAYLAGYPGVKFWTEDVLPAKPGLFVVDVSDRRYPTAIGSLAGSSWGSDAKIVIVPPLAYLIGPTGLYIIDISDPSQPKEISRPTNPESGASAFVDTDRRVAGYEPSESSPREIAVQDDFAYIASGSSGLRIVEVGTPGSPKDVASIALGFTQRVVLSSHFAVIHEFQVPHQAGGWNGLRIIDVSQPEAPNIVASLPTSDNQFSGAMAALNEHIYASDGAHDILVVSLSRAFDSDGQ